MPLILEFFGKSNENPEQLRASALGREWMRVIN
jgi:hypothetical protein